MTVVLDRLPALRLSFCQDGDVPALMKFIGDHWRAGHILSRDEALLRWQFAPTRMPGQAACAATVLLACLDADIVGMLGLTGSDFNIAGHRFSAVWLSHWFALAAHRRHAVALRLLWAARDLGVDVLATLGANRVADSLLGRLGMDRVPALTRWVGVLDPRTAAALVQAANRDRSAVDAEALCRNHLITPAETAAGRAISCVPWSAVAIESWDRFWSGWLAPRMVGAARDASYLRWRYTDHPRFEYQLRVAQRDDGSIEGLAVWRVEQVRGGPKAHVLRILDFIATPSGAAALVPAVVAAGRRAEASFTDFHCSSLEAAEPLRRAGFRAQPTDPESLVFPSRLQPLEAGFHQMVPLARLPEGYREMLSDGRLYVTSADCDQDRPN